MQLLMHIIFDLHSQQERVLNRLHTHTAMYVIVRSFPFLSQPTVALVLIATLYRLLGGGLTCKCIHAIVTPQELLGGGLPCKSIHAIVTSQKPFGGGLTCKCIHAIVTSQKLFGGGLTCKCIHTCYSYLIEALRWRFYRVRQVADLQREVDGWVAYQPHCDV